MNATPLLLALAILLPAAARAQAPSADLEQRLNALSKEVQALKQEQAAQKKEKTESSLEWGGFAEMTYQNFGDRNQKGNPAGLRDTADMARVSLDAVYQYTEKIKAKFELEVLHAGVFSTNNTKGSVAVEQAWVEDKIRKEIGLKGGLVVVPLGLVNEKHRPNDYFGVFRPNVETTIIPSTWREFGAGVFGDLGPVSYRTYLVGGLSAVANGTEDNKGFLGSTALKDGRTLGASSSVQKGAWVGRADFNLWDKSFVGAGAYFGKADQNLMTQTAPVTVWEVHSKLLYKGAELRALYGEGTIGNADAINQAQKLAAPAFTDTVGRRFWGGYAEAGYDVMPVLHRTDELLPFYRYERYDTAAQIPNGFVGNPADSRTEHTLGFNYRPVHHLVVKAEYQWLRNQARTGVHEWNLGLGWDF